MEKKLKKYLSETITSKKHVDPEIRRLTKQCVNKIYVCKSSYFDRSSNLYDETIETIETIENILQEFREESDNLVNKIGNFSPQELSFIDDSIKSVLDGRNFEIIVNSLNKELLDFNTFV